MRNMSYEDSHKFYACARKAAARVCFVAQIIALTHRQIFKYTVASFLRPVDLPKLVPCLKA